MIAKKYDEVEKQKIQMDQAKGISIRWLIGPDQEAPNFYLRHFEVEPGGHTPYHTHPWEHEVYVLEGKGKLNTKDKSLPLEKNYFALVMPGEEHQFENTGDTTLEFLCVIPTEGL